MGRWGAEAKEVTTRGSSAWRRSQRRGSTRPAESFGRGRTRRKCCGAEGFRKAPADRSLEGHSDSNASSDFPKALQALPGGSRRPKSLPQGPAHLGLPAYPEYTSDGEALGSRSRLKPALGERVAGPTSNYISGKLLRVSGTDRTIPKDFRSPADGPRPITAPGNVRGLGEGLGGPEGLRD